MMSSCSVTILSIFCDLREIQRRCCRLYLGIKIYRQSIGLSLVLMLSTVFCGTLWHTSCTSLSYAELEFQFSIPLQRFANQTRSEGQSYLVVIAQQNESRHLLITSFSLLLKFRNHTLKKDTTNFLNFIEKMKVAKGTMLVSMDVASLYTKGPGKRQKEGINIVCNAYETFHLNKPPIPTLYLRDMLGLILKENSFHLNGKNYLQTHGRSRNGNKITRQRSSR